MFKIITRCGLSVIGASLAAALLTATPGRAASLVSPHAAAQTKAVAADTIQVQHAFRGGGGGGGFRGGMHGGGMRGGGFHGGGVRAFHGGGVRTFHGGRPGFHGGTRGYVRPAFVGHRHGHWHRGYPVRHRVIGPRFYGPRYYAPVSYGYYGPRSCRTVWTDFGPRRICRPWRAYGPAPFFNPFVRVIW